MNNYDPKDCEILQLLIRMETPGPYHDPALYMHKGFKTPQAYIKAGIEIAAAVRKRLEYTFQQLAEVMSNPGSTLAFAPLRVAFVKHELADQLRMVGMSPSVCLLGATEAEWKAACKKALQQAFELFKEAAPDDGRAMLQLAEAYGRGRGCAKDLTQAAFWLDKADELAAVKPDPYYSFRDSIDSLRLSLKLERKPAPSLKRPGPKP